MNESREEEKKITVGIIGLIAVIALIVAGIILFQNISLIEKDRNLRRNQARAVAEKAEALIDEGDDYTAIRILMEVLPDGVFNGTVEPEVEGALRKAWNNNSAILRGHNDIVQSAVYDSSGQTIMSASWDGTVKIWDAQNGCMEKTIPINSRVSCAYFSPDDSRIVTTSWNGTVQVWNAVSGDLEKTIGIHSWVPACFWRDNDHLLVLDTIIRIMDIGSKPEQTICSFVPEKRLDQLNLSDDGKYIVASSMDNRIYLWDVESGEKREIGEHEKLITKTILSKDGKTCFSSSEDGTIKIWDCESCLCKNVYYIGESAMISTMDVYDDELIAFVCHDNIEIYNLETEDIVFTYNINLPGFVSSICWNKDGNQLVVACSAGILKVINISSTYMLGTFDFGEVMYVQFSPNEEEMSLIIDDSIVAFFDGESISRTWNTGSHGLISIDYSPDGNNLMSVSKEGFLEIWECPSGKLMNQIQTHHGQLYEAYYRDCRLILSV